MTDIEFFLETKTLRNCRGLEGGWVNQWVMVLDVALLCSDSSSFTRNSSHGHYRCSSPAEHSRRSLKVMAPGSCLCLAARQLMDSRCRCSLCLRQAGEDASLQDKLLLSRAPLLRAKGTLPCLFPLARRLDQVPGHRRSIGWSR